MYFDFFAATSFEQYHGKWIPTVGWKHIILLNTNKEYTEKTVTQALNRAKYNLELVPNSDLKIFHTNKWLDCVSSNQSCVRKIVHFFYIDENSRAYPIIENFVKVWQERYNMYVSSYTLCDSGKISGKKITISCSPKF